MPIPVHVLMPGASPRVHVDEGKDNSPHDHDNNDNDNNNYYNNNNQGQGILDALPGGDGTRSPGRALHTDAGSGSGKESDPRNGRAFHTDPGSGSGKESDQRRRLDRVIPLTAQNSSKKDDHNDCENNGPVGGSGGVVVTPVEHAPITRQVSADGFVSESQSPMLLLVEQALLGTGAGTGTGAGAGMGLGGGSEWGDVSEGLGESPDVFGFNLPNHRPRVALHTHSVSERDEPFPSRSKSIFNFAHYLLLLFLFRFSSCFFLFVCVFSPSSRGRCPRYRIPCRGQAASQRSPTPDTPLLRKVVGCLS